MANGMVASNEAIIAGIESLARLDPVFEKFSNEHGMSIEIDKKYGWPARGFHWGDPMMKTIAISMNQGDSGTFMLFVYATIKGHERECYKGEKISSSLSPAQLESNILERLNEAKKVIDTWTIESVKNSKRT